MGQTNNTILVFTTDNGAETITFPDGRTTLFKGGKLRGAFLGATLICDALETDWLAGAAESNYRISNDAVWLT